MHSIYIAFTNCNNSKKLLVSHNGFGSQFLIENEIIKSFAKFCSTHLNNNKIDIDTEIANEFICQLCTSTFLHLWELEAHLNKCTSSIYSKDNYNCSRLNAINSIVTSIQDTDQVNYLKNCQVNNKQYASSNNLNYKLEDYIVSPNISSRNNSLTDTDINQQSVIEKVYHKVNIKSSNLKRATKNKLMEVKIDSEDCLFAKSEENENICIDLSILNHEMKYFDVDEIKIENTDLNEIHLVIENEDVLKSKIIERPNLKRCNKCGIQFKNLNNYKNHLKVHTISRIKYNCYKCKKYYFSEKIYQSHQKRVHQNSSIEIKCKFCSKVFSTESYLKRHLMMTHNYPQKKMSHLCTYCGKVFYFRCLLNSHLVTHQNLQPFHCLGCSRSFKSRLHLRRHEQSHNAEKKFVCEHCTKQFKSRHSLMEHILHCHSNLRPFPCPSCHKAFATRDKLRKHKVQHLKPKISRAPRLTFDCQFCGRTCKDRSSLASHQRVHSREKPFSCQFCGKSFTFKHHVKKHLKNMFCTKNEQSRTWTPTNDRTNFVLLDDEANKKY